MEYMAYWGYAASAATLVVAVLGPVLGTLADTKGYKKPIFLISLLVGAVGCITLGFAKQWLIFLVIYVIAKIGFSSSLTFYDSMLVDVTTEERMDAVSSQGYAWGYIGSCVPFVACLLLVLNCEKLGIGMETAMAVSFAVIGIWWGGMSVPLLKTYEQKNYVEKQKGAFRESFRRLGRTLRLKQKRRFFCFCWHFSSTLTVFIRSLKWLRPMGPLWDWTVQDCYWLCW